MVALPSVLLAPRVPLPFAVQDWQRVLPRQALQQSPARTVAILRKGATAPQKRVAPAAREWGNMEREAAAVRE